MREILETIRLRPSTCVWEITYQCNMKCLHCASDLNSKKKRGKELNLFEARTVVKDLHSLGCERVVLSGGEALIRRDWDQIASEIISFGIPVFLISNGSMIDSKLARHIKKIGISLVALSLDGGKASHNYIRNNPEAFERVKKAAKYLNDQNILVNFVTHINTINIHKLREIEDIIVSLNANNWLIQLGSSMGRLSRYPKLIIKPDDLPIVADFIIKAKRRNRVNISVGDNIGYFSYHEVELRATTERDGLNFFCGCSAGCLNVGIEADGNVKGCLSLQSDEFVEGNVREESLIDIWHKKGNFSYNRDFKIEDLGGDCKDCKYGEICRGGCKFMSVGATGTPYGNPYCLHAVINNKSKSM